MKVSKKSVSKRKPLKQQFSIDKKARAHKKKLKKMARKSGLRKAHRKNPGIPNNWPFKTELLEEALRENEASLNAKKLRRGQKSDRRMEMDHGDTDTQIEAVGSGEKPQPGRDKPALGGNFWEASTLAPSGASLETIVEKAAADHAQFITTIETDAKEMPRGARAFAKDLGRVLEMSDVILQVLDARDPGSCLSSFLERTVRSSGKRLVYLINKVDLVPVATTKAWVEHLRKRAPVLAFKAALNCAERAHVSSTDPLRASESQLQSSSQVLGASALMQLLKNYCRTSSSFKNKISITAGIVGYPNVGKSSIINSLKRSSTATKVGAVPGVTRKLQEVPLDSNIRLVDAPGVIMHGTPNDASNVLRNGVAISSLKDPSAVVDELIRRCPKDSMMRFFKVPYFEDSSDFLTHVARVRGKFTKGGRPDSVAAARLALSDWTSGKIRYFTMPPAEDSEEMEVVQEIRVVSDLAPEFDVEALLRANDDEVSMLRNTNGQDEVEMTAAAA